MNRRPWLGTVLGILVGCAPIKPTPTISAQPSQSPPASPAPSSALASPSPVSVAFVASVQMSEYCGSLGGCAFYVDLSDGATYRTTEKMDVAGASPSHLPRRLPVGRYTLTFRSTFVSDLIINGAAPAEVAGASCQTTFEVAASDAIIVARGVFRADSCDVVIASS
jgi:hypothetical protein